MWWFYTVHHHLYGDSLLYDYHTDHRHHLYGDYHADHRHHLYGDSLLYVTPIFFFISDIPRLLRKHSYGKLYTQIAAIICIVILCCTSCLFVLHFRHNLFGDFILYICDSLLYVTLIFSSFQTYNDFFTNIPTTNSITLIAAITCMVILCCTSCLFLLHFRHDLCVDFILYITICMVILYCTSHLFFFFSDIPWFLHKHSYHQPYHPDHCYHLYGDSILYVTLHQSKPKTQTKDVHACTHRANCGKLYSSLYKFKKWDASWQNQQNECAHSKDSDQTGRMPRLIWVFAGRITTLLVLSCRGSNWDAWNNYCNLTNIWTVLVGCSWMWKMQKEW